MFGSTILDVALGLTLLFLLLSLMATAIREAIESILKTRAVYLERGIREMLGDRDGIGIAKDFYEHPLISSLFRGEFDNKSDRKQGGALPTYIPAKTFAKALMDLAYRGPVTPPTSKAIGGSVASPAMEVATAAVDGTSAGSAPTARVSDGGGTQTHVGIASTYSPTIDVQANNDLSVATLRDAATRIQNPHLSRAVLTALDHANGNLDKARVNLEGWFDASMDRVSGWYKRTTQLWLFVIGLSIAIVMNVNILTVAQLLWRDKELRQAVVAQAEVVAHDTTMQRRVRDTTLGPDAARETYRDISLLKLPIGWSDEAKASAATAMHAGTGSFVWYWLFALSGFVPTALAITLGAPFWFDALNKIMVIRSTVKPHEKSREEDQK